MSGRGNVNSSQSNAASVTSELRQWSKSDDISEEGLHQIIRRHKSATNNLHVSDYQFFHAACRNNKVTEGIIRYLLECFPAAVNEADDRDGRLPLHYACKNNNVSLGIIELLIDKAPDSVRHEDNYGRCLPLHLLCDNNHLDEAAALRVVRLLLEKYPESIRQRWYGSLPIHIAAMAFKSPEFCRVLIEAYPGSERIADILGMMPLHHACINNAVETVEYLYKLYPDAIHRAAPDDVGNNYPIHVAFKSVIHTRRGANPGAAADIVKFLLDCDPRVKLQNVAGTVPMLALATLLDYNDTNIGAAMEIIEAIYDARPEAFEHRHFNDPHVRNPRLQPFVLHPEVRTFINDLLVYFLQAKDEHVMTAPDENGRLPLHKALQNSVRLGSIKLLVKGNPHAVRAPDNDGALPLHVACMHHESTRVVQYLIECDATALAAVDNENNTALHYACRGAKFETITLLLEEYDAAASVSKQNAKGKLPIDLLCESNEVVDRDSVEYTESVYRLMRAYPETVMNYI